MEVKKKKMEFLGRAIEFFLIREDFSKDFGDPGLTDSLVRYHVKNNIVRCDSRAEDWYCGFAALHETICCGPYEFIVPKRLFVKPVDAKNFLKASGVSGEYQIRDIYDRCGVIDLIITEKMPRNLQKDYIEKRIEMFRTLLSRKLYGNDEDLKQGFERALELLKNRLKNN